MYVAGNDFVIVDNRDGVVSLTEREILKITNRKTGIGCDQLLILKKSAVAKVAVEIYNNDASSAESCGNGLRCVANLLMDEMNLKEITISVGARVFHASSVGNNTVKIKMGTATFDANLTKKLRETFGNNVEYVNVGNPHVVFLEEDNFKELNLEKVERLKQSEFFNKILPNGTNVEFMCVENKNRICLRILERGAGITEACGSGACAAEAVAVKNKLCSSPVKIVMPGGTVIVEIPPAADSDFDVENITLTGEVNFAFEGMFFL
jgi:diaminopimelate epimerase